MSRNIVHEGWLTKSPPSRGIWRTKWRRRWFALRQSGQLPGQYFLDYYADRNCRRLKGSINLDLCEQVDAGLCLSSSGTFVTTGRGSVFTIQTISRFYHLQADSEADMEKWVDAICRVCGLRATDESGNELEPYQADVGTMTAMNEHYQRTGDSTGPYIPISECITGVRAQGEPTRFNFDPKKIAVSTQTPFDRMSDNRAHQMYLSQPHIRLNNTELSEYDSNLSEDECRSLNASQSNIQDYTTSVTKSFTKLAIDPKRNVYAHSGWAPPRPPKTMANRNQIKEMVHFQGPKIQEPIIESPENVSPHPCDRRQSQGAQSAPYRPFFPQEYVRTTDDEEDNPAHVYYNVPLRPPAVDRALKPRHSSHNIGYFLGEGGMRVYHDERKSDKLQYLDLDLPNPVPIKPRDKKLDISHGKSLSDADGESAYKTVDFVKTEAFNITRQDAEALRSIQY